MQRLTSFDASFLHFETPSTHMHIAFTAVFEQPEGALFTLQSLKALVSSRLEHVPLLRRRLREVPFHLHNPVWVEDPDFDLDYHVRRLVAPSPGGREQLGEVVSDVMSRQLDRSRPLWELYLVEQLEEGRFALISKVHHAAVDGVSGTELMAILLAPEPTPVPPFQQPTSRPGRIPDDAAMLSGALVDLLHQPSRLAKMMLRSSTRPPNTDKLPPLPAQVPPWRSPLNKAITPHRRVVLTELSFTDVRAVKQRLGGTVNDVVLAICATALRQLLDRHGVTASPPLVALVPVSVRAENERGTMGNRVSFILVPLATENDDPIERLDAIRQSTETAKKLRQTVPAPDLADWVVLGGPRVVSQAALRYSQMRLADLTAPPYHLVISNVPGPQHSWYCGTSRMTALYPTGPLGDGMGLNITLASYQDQLCFSLNTCPDTVSSAEIIAQDLHQGLADLLTRSSAR